MLTIDELAAREDDLRRRAGELPDEARRSFYARLEKECRDPDTYAVLNYLFITGLHHFYLREYGRGALNLGLFVLGIALLLGGTTWLGLLIIVSTTLVELPALFRSQAITREYNIRLMERLLGEAGS